MMPIFMENKDIRVTLVLVNINNILTIYSSSTGSRIYFPYDGYDNGSHDNSNRVETSMSKEELLEKIELTIRQKTTKLGELA